MQFHIDISKWFEPTFEMSNTNGLKIDEVNAPVVDVINICFDLALSRMGIRRDIN